MPDKEKIKKLERLIEKHKDYYYNGEAEISDGEFDLLWDELKALSPDSPVLKKVGTKPNIDGFPKVRHLIPMGSQDKASNPQEFLDWAKKMGLSAENKEMIRLLIASTMLTAEMACCPTEATKTVLTMPIRVTKTFSNTRGIEIVYSSFALFFNINLPRRIRGLSLQSER